MLCELGEPREALLAQERKYGDGGGNYTQTGERKGSPSREVWGKQLHPFTPPTEPRNSRDREAVPGGKLGTQMVPAGGRHGHVAGPTQVSLPAPTSRLTSKGLIRKEASRTPDELSRGETRPSRLHERKRTCRPHWQESELSGKMTAT